MGESNDEECSSKGSKASNVLPLWGNERTMNLNPLILTNIQSSHYFKVNLYELKTYHEVVDEIYYKVQHLEPWEKGSRRTAGQTGMCGGVRGVGAGGIVSTAYCLLYKLFTLKLTRKQLNGLITHCDSPYIRALGFMYMRYAFPPGTLIDWYEPYFDDEEEMDVKAGGGQVMRLGMILRQWLVKLEWFSTLFPRIPVPIQQKIAKAMENRFPMQANQVAAVQREDRDRGETAARPERGGAERRDSRERDAAVRDRETIRDRDNTRDAFRDNRGGDDRTKTRDRRGGDNRDRFLRDDPGRDEPRYDRYRDDFDRKSNRDDFERKDRNADVRVSKDKLRDDNKERKYRERSPHKERSHRRGEREGGSREREHKHKRHHR